ncbi:MAG: YueI family protein [Lactobacillales bacterium]|jgi:uncharacterized protein YueI|nr:YueI family protein [Lactobacillales bacterium]
MTDEVQERLEQGMYGTPKIKPDELKKYMGTYRERVFLTMTIEEMKNDAYTLALEKELDNEEETVSLNLNGEMDTDLQTKYIKLAKQYDITFTLVNNDVKNTPDSLGLVLYGKEAVNVSVVDVAEKYPNAVEELLPKKEEPEKKESFWKKIFR